MKPSYLAAATLAAAAVGVAATPALAVKNRGVYVGAGGGYNLHEDSTVRGAGGDTEIEWDDGWAAMGAIGWSWGGPRIELEGAYRENDADSVGGIDASGDLKQASLMGNFLYDFNNSSSITPYIGAGLGAAWVDYDDAGDDTVFAYQFIGGLNYDITDKIGLFADYRYFGTEDADVSTGGSSVRVDNISHTFMVGLRYSFGSPEREMAPTPVAVRPAAPVAQPAVVEPEQPATRAYLVFFDFDKATLTPEARRIIQNAAQTADSGRVTRINVTGHADRSGPAQYNVRLSEARAESVARELVQNGVPENEIAIYARGETQPLVATGDGVREPQNRRVQIVLD